MSKSRNNCANINKEFYCHDCGKEIKFKGKKILNGKYLNYGEAQVFKCNVCYKKDKSLTMYQPCEVYSRVVGYYRPISQWNEAKQQEFKNRKNYKIKK